MFKRALFVLCAVVITYTAAQNFLPEFQVCERVNSDNNQCLKAAIQNALPLLEKGIPDLELPSLQPIIIPSAVISPGSGPVAVVQNFKNIRLYDFVKAHVNNVKSEFTPNSFQIDIDAFLANYTFAADYDVDGQVLGAPIAGKGKSSFILKNLTITFRLSAKIFKKGDTAYSKLTDLNVSLLLGGVLFDLQNLFNGDGRLEKSMNEFLNENWKVISEDVKSSYEELIAVYFKAYVNTLLRKIPFDVMFPEKLEN